MQKRFGGIVRVVQGIKTNVDALEKRNVPKELDEVKEILDAQKVIDEVIVANPKTIKRIDMEINEFTQNTFRKVLKYTSEENRSDGSSISVKKC